MVKNKDYYIKLYIECAMTRLIEKTDNKDAINLFQYIKKEGNITIIHEIDLYMDRIEDYLKENNLTENKFRKLIKKSSYEFAKNNDIPAKDWQLGYYLTNYFIDPYREFENDLAMIDIIDNEFILYDIERADKEFKKILKNN